MICLQMEIDFPLLLLTINFRMPACRGKTRKLSYMMQCVMEEPTCNAFTSWNASANEYLIIINLNCFVSGLHQSAGAACRVKMIGAQLF